MTRLLQYRVSAPTAERAAEIESLGPWFHNLHLPDGSQTAPAHPLGDFPAQKWQEIADCLPGNIAGWTALDIGCNAGFHTLKLAERGVRVTGLDVDPFFLRQAEWAAREFGVSHMVRFQQRQVYDLAHDAESYDLVLFMGVFYHLRYPQLGLDIVAEKVRHLMVFQTLTMPGTEVDDSTDIDRDIEDREAFRAPGWPKMAFIEHRFSGDETNWWAPNHAGVEAMLRSSGMRVTMRPGRELYVCEPDLEKSAWARSRGRAEFRAATGRGDADASD